MASINNITLDYTDEKYEFCAPKYFDFSKEESPDEAAQAESWFRTPKGYLPSPFVAKTRSLLESTETSSNSSTYNAVQKLIARVSFEHGEPNISSSGSNEIPTGNDASENVKINSESRGAIGTTITCPSDSPNISKVAGNASENDIPEDTKISDESGETITTAVKRASDNLKISEIPGSGYLSVSSKLETEICKTACLFSSEKKQLNLSSVSNSDNLKISEISGSSYLSVSSDLETESSKTACLFSSEKKQMNLSSVLAYGSSSGKIDKSAFASQEEQGALSAPKIGSEASLSSSLVVGSLIEGQSNSVHITKDTTLSASIVCEGKHKDNHSATENSKQYGTSFEIQVAVGNHLANQDCQVVEKHEAHVRRHAKKKMLKRPLARSERPQPEIPSTSLICTESQYANKRQKLEGGRSRQVCNLRGHIPIVKAVPTLTIPQEFHFCTEERFQTHRGTHCQAFAQGGNPASPYVPLAERVLRFQFHDTERLLTWPENQPLKLTRPKEPDLFTSQRARPTRIKSSAELEEEMLANIPKFKARPLNKKILEAPTLPPLPRSIPQPPEFQEFNLRTEERAHLHPNQSGKLISGPEIKFVSASHKCSSMLNSGFSAPYGHYVPTSIKHRTVERIEEEKEPRKRFKLLEYSSDMKSMPYQPEEASHLQMLAQENSSQLRFSAMNVFPSATTQNYGRQIPHAAAEDVHDSMGLQNSQHVILKENMPHPSQIISGSSTLGLKSEAISHISREKKHVSEKKRTPLSEICTPHPTQFGLKENNCEPRPCTLKGKSFFDQSPAASDQNYSVPGHPKESLQTAALQIKNDVFARQDNQTVSSLSVPHHMR